MKAIMLFVPIGMIFGYLLADVAQPLSLDKPIGAQVASASAMQS